MQVHSGGSNAFKTHCLGENSPQPPHPNLNPNPNPGSLKKYTPGARFALARGRQTRRREVRWEMVRAVEREKRETLGLMYACSYGRV